MCFIPTNKHTKKNVQKKMKTADFGNACATKEHMAMPMSLPIPAYSTTGPCGLHQMLYACLCPCRCTLRPCLLQPNLCICFCLRIFLNGLSNPNSLDLLDGDSLGSVSLFSFATHDSLPIQGAMLQRLFRLAAGSALLEFRFLPL